MRHLNGDLNQMATQMSELSRYGIRVKVDGGIPFIEDAEYKRALSIIWVGGISGWWNYKKEFIQHDICAEKEFMERLRRE